MKKRSSNIYYYKEIIIALLLLENLGKFWNRRRGEASVLRGIELKTLTECLWSNSWLMIMRVVGGQLEVNCEISARINWQKYGEGWEGETRLKDRFIRLLKNNNNNPSLCREVREVLSIVRGSGRSMRSTCLADWLSTNTTYSIYGWSSLLLLAFVITYLNWEESRQSFIILIKYKFSFFFLFFFRWMINCRQNGVATRNFLYKICKKKKKRDNSNFSSTSSPQIENSELRTPFLWPF